MDYNLGHIPGDFIDTSTQASDPVYMTKLYDLGFRLAQAGYPWKKRPPRMVGHLPPTLLSRNEFCPLSVDLGFRK